MHTYETQYGCSAVPLGSFFRIQLLPALEVRLECYDISTWYKNTSANDVNAQ